MPQSKAWGSDCAARGTGQNFRRLSVSRGRTRWSRGWSTSSSTAWPSWDAPCPSWELSTNCETMLRFGGGFHCRMIMDVSSSMASTRAHVRSSPSLARPFTVNSRAERGSTQIGGLPRKGFGRHRPEDRLPHVLRYAVFKGWNRLGLAAELNVENKGVHASAGPFEALAERANWLGVPLESDNFGRAMAGYRGAFDHDRGGDPVVPYQIRLSSCLPWVEDLDSRYCLRKSASISARFSLQRREASFRPDGHVCQRCPKLESCACCAPSAVVGGLGPSSLLSHRCLVIARSHGSLDGL